MESALVDEEEQMPEAPDEGTLPWPRLLVVCPHYVWWDDHNEARGTLIEVSAEGARYAFIMADDECLVYEFVSF